MLRDLADLPDGAEAPLEIRLFGDLELARAGFTEAHFATRKARSIFARLVLERDRAHFRDELAECFWPETEPGASRAALRTELWRIRLVLARYGLNPCHYLETGIDTIRFRPRARVLIDVELFDGAVSAEARPEPDCAHLIALYRADLLAGEYGDWCHFEREHYRGLFAAALEAVMMRAMAACDHNQALDLGNRLVALDPLAEPVHRRLIACHAARGDRAAALRQYARCAAILERELRIAPMVETCALAERVRTGAEPSDARFAGSGGEEVEAALRLVRQALREAASQLDDALIARQHART